METSRRMDEIRRILEEIARVPINIESRVNIVNPSFIYPIFLQSNIPNTDDLLNLIDEKNDYIKSDGDPHYSKRFQISYRLLQNLQQRLILVIG